MEEKKFLLLTFLGCVVVCHCQFCLQNSLVVFNSKLSVMLCNTPSVYLTNKGLLHQLIIFLVRLWSNCISLYFQIHQHNNTFFFPCPCPTYPCNNICNVSLCFIWWIFCLNALKILQTKLRIKSLSPWFVLFKIVLLLL